MTEKEFLRYPGEIHRTVRYGRHRKVSKLHENSYLFTR